MTAPVGTAFGIPVLTSDAIPRDRIVLARVCWKCQGATVYRVTRWVESIGQFVICWKRCDCQGAR